MAAVGEWPSVVTSRMSPDKGTGHEKAGKRAGSRLGKALKSMRRVWGVDCGEPFVNLCTCISEESHTIGDQIYASESSLWRSREDGLTGQATEKKNRQKRLDQAGGIRGEGDLSDIFQGKPAHLGH